MRSALTAGLLACAVALCGCAAAVGAGAAGGAYEYQNRQTLEQLDRDFKQGRISREEYLRRRDAIEGRSLVY